MIGRKQELNIQYQQILDGGLLVLAFWAANVIWSGRPLPVDSRPGIPDFNDFRWVLFVLMPFGPVTFWAAHVIRSALPLAFDSVPGIPNFNDFRWVLFILMPFGPIILEMQGFYSHILQKTFLKSTMQLGRAGFVLGLLIAMAAFFFRYPFPSRGILVIFALLALGWLLPRERLTVAYLQRKEVGDA
jgi:hypothetical protein